MSNYRDTIEHWSKAIRDNHELPGRADTYRELVHANISGLLRTNLPRTHALMGVQKWDDVIQAFLQQRVQHSPYFVDLAAEFAATLANPIEADLAHFEALCLEVETTIDEDTRRLAAYEHDVLQDPPTPRVTFLQLHRDPATAAVLMQEISASVYVMLAETVI